MTAIASARARVSKPWVKWVVENVARGAPAERIAYELEDRGLDRAEALALVTEVAEDPLLDVCAELIHERSRYVDLLDTFERLSCLRGQSEEIERRIRVSHDEFFDRYYAANRPVVLSDAGAQWPALSAWTPEHLGDRFGNEIVEVQTDRRTEPVYHAFLKGNTSTMKFQEYVEAVTQQEESPAIYLTANDGLFGRPAFRSLLGDIGPLPSYLEEGALVGCAHFWFGPKGAVSPLHRDYVNVLMVQVLGRKRVKMIGPYQSPDVYNERSFYSLVDAERPDLARFPRFAKVRLIETVLEPGEGLFIPVAWWHHVRSLDVTISVTFTNFRWPNVYRRPAGS
jgi:hypothetical protein